MKTILCCFVCLALPAALHAATWTVDNIEEHPADFRTIQQAVDAAAVGDTILVAGSNFGYGGFTLTKRLNIKGERQSPVSLGTRVVSLVILTEIFNDVSPDHLRNAGGSILEGLELQGLNIHGPCKGIAIRRCDNPHDNTRLQGCSGTLITSCRIGGLLVERGGNDGGRGIGTGNSIIGSWIGLMFPGDPTSTLLQNCVVGSYVGGELEQNGPIQFGAPIAPFVIRNSVVIAKNTAFIENASTDDKAKVVFDHCLLISGSTLPAGNGNINRAYNQFATVFVDATPNSIEPDGFVLKAGSPAIGAGIGGVDLGMYGGLSPFVKDFIPALPRINYLAVPPVVPDSTGLTFEVRAESRD